MNRIYSLPHASVDFYFRQASRDFIVEEIPLYEFSNDGEHLILHVRKKDLSTMELISIIAEYLGINQKDIGYAGLKDKHAMTKQYISLHKKYEEQMNAFTHSNIKILSKTYHDNKIRTGHLKGNRFYIKIKKVMPSAAKIIDQALKSLKEHGMPNFYGYQRFGNDGDNYIIGEKIAKGERKESNIKLKKLFISAYQSHLFNKWLNKRLQINSLVDGFSVDELVGILELPKDEIEKLKTQKHPFKIISGDIMEHYPHGKLFDFDGTEHDLNRFNNRDISVTGLMTGKKVKLSTNLAGDIEKEFFSPIGEDGARRYAWVYPTDIEGKYNAEDAQYEFHFSLPKGSYATVFLEEIAKRKIDINKI